MARSNDQEVCRKQCGIGWLSIVDVQASLVLARTAAPLGDEHLGRRSRGWRASKQAALRADIGHGCLAAGQPEPGNGVPMPRLTCKSIHCAAELLAACMEGHQGEVQRTNWASAIGQDREEAIRSGYWYLMVPRIRW